MAGHLPSAAVYSGRESIIGFKFSALTIDYLREQCRGWYNLPVPFRLGFGGDPLRPAALQVTFGTLPKAALAARGLQRLSWAQSAGPDPQADPIGCTPADQCPSCVARFDPFVALDGSIGCIPADEPQPASCCKWAAGLVTSRCASQLLYSDPTFQSIGIKARQNTGVSRLDRAPRKPHNFRTGARPLQHPPAAAARRTGPMPCSAWAGGRGGSGGTPSRVTRGPVLRSSFRLARLLHLL